MIHLIDKFETTLSEINGTITVNDRHDILTGYCEYRIVEVNNRFKQKAWLLTNTDMGDVIEYMHSNMPLSDNDLMVVDKLIRDHSLKAVQDLHR
jgi:2-hydroxy-3-keto-5-methylthiopentenyl-1-phosphate phosphatase